MAYKVFLSSTSKDLAAFRGAVHRAIDALDGFELIHMETFGARDTDARGIDEQKLREADLLVGLMGHCYGSSPPDDPTSYTEQEYDFALLRDLPRLMFVAPDDFPVPQHLIESDDKRARQKAFRARVMVDRVVASFASPEQLATGVNTALANWRVDRITAELVAAKAEAAGHKAGIAKRKKEAVKYKARAAELDRALQEGQEDRKALRAAVQALADKAQEPEAPPKVEQALALLPEGRTAEAQAVFAEIMERRRVEGTAALQEAAAAARHLGALAYLDSTQKAIEAYQTATELDPDHTWSWIYLGRLYRRAGNLADAEQALQKAREAAERSEDERDVMVSDMSLGDVRVARGDLAGAVAAYEAGLASAKERVAQGPSDTGWQRDLSFSFIKIGDVQSARDNLDAALKAYRDGLAIAQKLAAKDPSNSGWQRDLSVSFTKIGDVQSARGNLDAALKT
jgi:tetratricopeptide (TPR) repeat protein